MKPSRMLIFGGAVALVVWLSAFLLLREGGDPGSPAAALPPESAVPPAAPPSAPEDAPEQGVPAEPPRSEPAEPTAGTPVPVRVARIPRPPRKALKSFRDAGEICVDAETGRMLAGTNVRRRCPPASVTKLMTLFLTLEALDAGKISLTDVVPASRRAYSMGGTQLNLDTGEPCRIEELIYGLMLQSANDAAVVLAETVSGSVEDFVAAMNAKARELGLYDTRFATPHGLPPSRRERAAGASPDLTTAEDLAKLSVALLKRFPNALRYASTITHPYPANEKRKAVMWLKNHNRLLETFEGCDGLKTGWTNDGASIVTTASRGNRRVIAVVLGGLVKNAKGEIDAKTSQRERNQRAAELMYRGLLALDAMQYAPTPFREGK
ncbi:MAG: D-alanyl-D-alanine carboxypeptidase family protein [Candidatus Spyradosoma sp.]